MADKNNIVSKSDGAIIGTLGAFIKHHRLEQNKTQNQLANESGINRSTLVEFENGQGVSLKTFIQLLRALGLLHTLEAFKIELQISPLQLAKLEQQKRKRASKAKTKKRNTKSSW
jgi:transcriptional regulator with XRE-family HTH domain